MDEYKIDLINKAKNGDKIALEKLIKEEQNNIRSMLFYLKKDLQDTNDILQDILIKLSNKIHQLRDPKYFKTWLNQIIINSYYDYLRRTKKFDREILQSKDNSNIFFDIADYSTNPSEKILNNELDFIIKTSINNLPIRYKVLITLREIQGLTYGEISNITNTTIGTVKSRIARARAMIKNDIDRYSKE